MTRKTAVAAEGVTSVDVYLETLPVQARTTLMKLRASIRSVAPEETTEGLYYGVPAFLWKKGPAEYGLAGYAAGKKFCSYYPMSGKVITALHEDLKSYKTTKGSIHFALDKPLPQALVRQLIQRRLEEIEAKR